MALAPLSVVPEYQRRGIGNQLIREGLVVAKNRGYTSVIVIGHSDYYSKLGFKPARTWNIQAPFEIPDSVFFAVELRKNSLRDVQGMVEYPREFNNV